MSKCIRCGRELDTGSSNNMCSDCLRISLAKVVMPINNDIHYVCEDKALTLIKEAIAKEEDEHTLKVLKSLHYDLLHIEESSGSGIGRIGDVVTCPSHPDGTDNITAEVGEHESLKAKINMFFYYQNRLFFSYPEHFSSGVIKDYESLKAQIEKIVGWEKPKQQS